MILPWQNVISPAGDLTVFSVPIMAFSAVTYFIHNIDDVQNKAINPKKINIWNQ